MSYSFIILDLDNKLKLNDLNSFLAREYGDYEVHYCCSLNTQPIHYIRTYCFDKKENPEAIINRLINKCEKSNIVIIRKFTSFDDIKKQTDNLKKDNQIVMFKKPCSKFKLFFLKIIAFLTKVFFSKETKQINYSCQCFGTQATTVLKQIKYPANATRCGDWQGMDIVYVDGGQKYNFAFNNLKNALCTFIPLVASVALIVIFFLLNTKMTITLKFIAWIVAIISLLTSIIFGLLWFIKKQIGENIYQKAKIKGED